MKIIATTKGIIIKGIMYNAENTFGNILIIVILTILRINQTIIEKLVKK